ncbi:hypothetical protein ACFL4T_04610 [candidate division KSB1 bacterium]
MKKLKIISIIIISIMIIFTKANTQVLKINLYINRTIPLDHFNRLHELGAYADLNFKKVYKLRTGISIIKSTFKTQSLVTRPFNNIIFSETIYFEPIREIYLGAGLSYILTNSVNEVFTRRKDGLLLYEKICPGFGFHLTGETNIQLFNKFHLFGMVKYQIFKPDVDRQYAVGELYYYQPSVTKTNLNKKINLETVFLSLGISYSLKI